MARVGTTQSGVGEQWFERCAHANLAPLYSDGQGMVGKQCASCLRVFPFRACAMCNRQTVMREHSRDDWFCGKGCKRQSAALKAKAGA